MKSVIDRKLDAIRKGIYTFNEVGSVDMKKEICDILIRDYESGTITPQALESMITHYCNQIRVFKRITLDDVPTSIRDKVSDKLNS